MVLTNLNNHFSVETVIIPSFHWFTTISVLFILLSTKVLDCRSMFCINFSSLTVLRTMGEISQI